MRTDPHDGISALLEETPWCPVTPSPHEDIGEDSMYEPGSGLSPEDGSAGAWIPDIQPPE